MITEEQAKEIIHGRSVNDREQLITLLGIYPLEPLSVKELKEKCVRVGLRNLAKKNISDILAKSNRWVARTDRGWELQAAGKARLNELAGALPMRLEGQMNNGMQADEKLEKLQPVIKSEKRRVLIIHGHDERNLFALKDLLRSKLRLPEPVIMAQQIVPGASLPEKFEQLAASVDFAVALLTPDDLGRAREETNLQPRARQNTIIEIGWFWGRLGRDRVLLLVKEKLELPSDLQGVEYYRFNEKVEEVLERIRDFFAAHDL
jgi:hypothetical protein